MGGFVGGMIVGTITVLVLGAMLSLNMPLASQPNVAVSAPQPSAAEVPDTVADATDAGGDSDVLELPPTTPEAVDDQSDTLSELLDVEIEPEAQPEVTENAPQADAPSVAQSVPVAVTTEAPIAPQTLPVPQGSPNSEATPQVSLEVPEPQPQPSIDPNPEVAEAQPTPEPKVDDIQVQPEISAVSDPEEENPFTDSPIAVEGDEDTAPRNLPRIASVPQIGGTDTAVSGPLVGKRVVPLTERDDVIEVSTTGPEIAAPGMPIEAYAAKFENPESKPLMSIILIDDEGAYGAEALRDFPYPLSFAVSPSDPEAVEKMARHREAGFEVLAMADLHEAASAQDAEVSLAVWLDTLPETVGILEGVDSGIQGNRKLADQVAAIAADTGRGLITQDNGLNTVQKLAARNGVPSGVIFRDIDGARQDPQIMRRFLDQAAFRAGQEGTVVMLGRLRPDTISALLLWGLEDRGSRVAMAPISAVMMKEVQ
ncbi:Divergent polysaccharide deacetylase [Ruegeria denitrificans]|uniref:Divergent polysaccharide deacetylase n=2 Tax=Ruegeria denitrificans TaxID=1715692 RepID=A0A0P1I729_9RHOB|nr:Divergent polysaccharide deacetylase [Ruegeria denitrificans]